MERRSEKHIDAGLARMVESLTGVPCGIEDCGGHYLLRVDYGLHRDDPVYIEGIRGAIEGRLGDSLLAIDDNREGHELIVRAEYAESGGTIMGDERDVFEPDLRIGRRYCRRLREVRAVRVTRENFAALRGFVGGGRLSDRDGELSFTFLNGPVFCYAGENDYICTYGDGHFFVVSGEEFTKEWEAR